MAWQKWCTWRKTQQPWNPAQPSCVCVCVPQSHLTSGFQPSPRQPAKRWSSDLTVKKCSAFISILVQYFINVAAHTHTHTHTQTQSPLLSLASFTLHHIYESRFPTTHIFKNLHPNCFHVVLFLGHVSPFQEKWHVIYQKVIVFLSC